MSNVKAIARLVEVERAGIDAPVMHDAMRGSSRRRMQISAHASSVGSDGLGPCNEGGR